MAYDRFLIAPINTGWETDLKPWLIPDDAFQLLYNMYVFRGRLRKRYGSKYMGQAGGLLGPLASRLAINIGTTDGSGDLTETVPGAIFAIGQQFSINFEIFTVSVLGTPGVLLTTGSSTTHTFDTTTGQFIVLGAAINTIVYYYPAQPVMGITVYETGAFNNQPSYAFDTQFAYVFDTGLARWVRSQSAGNPVFQGSNSEFFWAETWRGITPGSQVLFVTNFNASVPAAVTDDPMWSFDGTTWTIFSTSTIFLTDGSFVVSARIIIGFKNRLLLLNTIEQDAGGNNSAHINRCRYSINGSPFANNAWLEPNNTNAGSSASGAGFIDAPTAEEIIGAEFIKDQLIVFFEQSTWSLVYTGNQVLPFVWQKINTELGCDGAFSTVPFDKVVLAIGSTGVHACNGSNVERIDNRIPDKIFQIPSTANGAGRIWGIRDYFTEMVYWAIPTNLNSGYVFPNSVLIYNYKNNAWALNDDTITAFGYFQQQIGLLWENAYTLWEEADFEWDSGTIVPNFRQVIAGNQQGYITIISPDISVNAAVRQITNITITSAGQNATLTIINHMLGAGNYIYIQDVAGITNMNGLIFRVNSVPTVNTLTIQASSLSNLFVGVYEGAGIVSLVSNPLVISKQWNPYVNQDRNVYLAKIDFSVQPTTFGQLTVDYLISSSEVGTTHQAQQTGTIVGTGILSTAPYPSIPFEESQTRLWHPVYFQGEGECIQIVMTLSDAQIKDTDIAFEDIQIEGMTLYTMPTSSRMQ